MGRALTLRSRSTRSARLFLAHLLVPLACLGTAGPVVAQAAPGDEAVASSRFTFGPRLELGYAFDAGTSLGGLGVFGEVSLGSAAGGELALVAAGSEFVLFEGDGTDPWVFEGGVSWGSADGRLLLDATAGAVQDEAEDGSEPAFKAAVGREYRIEPGRSLRVHLALRLLEDDEVTFGIVGSYSFKPFG